jgi:flagellar biosynthetic protein FliR
MQFLMALWYYFSWNGHLLLLQAFTETLKLIPTAGIEFWPIGELGLGRWIQQIFTLGLRMVVPFYCSLLLADIGLGFLARTVPQMNIFVLGMPLKMGLGFVVIIMVLPLLIDTLQEGLEPLMEMALRNLMDWRMAL